MPLEGPNSGNQSSTDRLGQLTKPESRSEINAKLRDKIGFPVELPAGVKINYEVNIPFYAQKVKEDLEKAKGKINEVMADINNPKMKFGEIKEISISIDEKTLGTKIEIKCEYKDSIEREIEKKDGSKITQKIPSIWTSTFRFLQAPKGLKFWKERQNSITKEDKAKLLRKVLKGKEDKERQETQKKMDALLDQL